MQILRPMIIYYLPFLQKLNHFHTFICICILDPFIEMTIILNHIFLDICPLIYNDLNRVMPLHIL